MAIYQGTAISPVKLHVFNQNFDSVLRERVVSSIFYLRFIYFYHISTSEITY